MGIKGKHLVYTSHETNDRAISKNNDLEEDDDDDDDFISYCILLFLIVMICILIQIYHLLSVS